jgi:hypothetical protein
VRKVEGMLDHDNSPGKNPVPVAIPSCNSEAAYCIPPDGKTS